MSNVFDPLMGMKVKHYQKHKKYAKHMNAPERLSRYFLS